MKEKIKNERLAAALEDIEGERNQWQELVVSGKVLTSLDGLEECTELITLDFSNNYIESIEPICALSKLKRLFAQRNPFMDFVHLKRLQNLEELHVGGQWEDYDVGVLTLESYGPGFGPTVTTKVLKHLAPLEKLRTLSVYNHGLISLEQLQSLPNLQRLTLIRGDSIVNLATLAENRSLEELSLELTSFTNLKSLRTLRRLKKLTIEGMSKKHRAEIEPHIEKLKADGIDVVLC